MGVRAASAQRARGDRTGTGEVMDEGASYFSVALSVHEPVTYSTHDSSTVATVVHESGGTHRAGP